MPAVAGVTVSRKPAAFVGIAAVLLMVFGFLQGSVLTGDVSKEITVRITEKGMDPKQISTKVGQTIRWINNDELPHIIASDSFCQTEEECLEVETIFPGGSKSIVVPDGIEEGAYSYKSKTKSSFEGIIVIEEEEQGISTPSQSISSFLKQFGSSNNDDEDEDKEETQVEDEKKKPSAEVLAKVTSEQLPKNTNTKKKTVTNPVEEVQKLNKSSEVAGLHGSAHSKQFTQPETGAGIWLAIIIGAIGGLFASKGFLHRKVMKA